MRLQKSRVVIVGSGVVATSLARRMRRFPDIRLLGFVDDEPRLPMAELLSTYLGPIGQPPVSVRENAGGAGFGGFLQKPSHMR